MFEKIFNELFDDNFMKKMREVLKEYDDTEIKVEDDKDDTHSYFHSVSDKYDNGKHVSHKEKEIKNGKVLKDVNEIYQIEDKNKCNEKTKCTCDKTNECQEEKSSLSDYYEKKLKEASELLEQAQNTIKKQQGVITNLEKDNKEFRSKFTTLRDLFN